MYTMDKLHNEINGDNLTQENNFSDDLTQEKIQTDVEHISVYNNYFDDFSVADKLLHKHELSDKQKKYIPIKRLIDVVLSGSAIVTLSPVLVLLALSIKIDSPGPILFKQKRVGKGRELFEILKFRTMRMDTPKDMPTHMLSNPDQYITKTGRFLRKTSLDELPQLFNIFMSKMSIIGPRPALWNQDDLIAEREKYGANDITPGLTGWAQINGRDELEISVKAKLDGEYVKKIGLLMDIKCFLATIGSVLRSDGVIEGGTGEMCKEGMEGITSSQDKLKNDIIIGGAVMAGAIMGICLMIFNVGLFSLGLLVGAVAIASVVYTAKSRRKKKGILKKISHYTKVDGRQNGKSSEKKKILVVCQYYRPEPFRISDICEELVQRGHEVTVLTGVPNYPEGTIYDDYKFGKKRDEVVNGVKVHRCFTIGRRTGSFFRFINYYSFVASSTFNVLINKYKPMDGEDYDVVFVNQLSPVMMAYAGMAYKKIHHKKLIMYCLDLWPVSLVAGGVNPESYTYKTFHHISKHIYKYCDHILVTSRMFVEYISSEFGVDKEKICYLPQYAEKLFNTVESNQETKNTIDLVFAGNIGEIQSVQTIIEAAELLKAENLLQFHIIGSGTDLERCKKLVKEKNLNNVIFYGRKPITDMPKYYAMADAMLVTLAADPILSLTLPGKVQSYMAAGKAIIGAVDGETKNVISDAGCGYIGVADNAEILARNIMSFMRLGDEDRSELGHKARSYYESKFERDIYMNQIEEWLKKMC